MELEQLEQKQELEEQEKVNLGNTKKQGSQHTYWCFTLNNYEIEDLEQLGQILKPECKWYLYQEETGKNGTRHLQGTISLKNRMRLSQLKKLDGRIHWEPTKCVKASVVYCSKSESRTGQIYTYGIEIAPNEDELEIERPTGWQLEVEKILDKKPDKRSIVWIYDPDGNKGKTTYAKYLVAKRNALMLTGKANDMYHMISKHPNKRKLFVVNIPRDKMDFVNYGAIEQMKDGLIFSGKYEGSQLLFNCPHVVVFANSMPDLKKMSLDRWKIYTIDRENLYDIDLNETF